MPVNLNNLNISLDQFNMAAKGQYNIGQLKLGEDGASVVRINNHKFFTRFNRNPIRPEESLALKNAFCNALSKEGLSDETVSEIRKKLGLGDTILDTLTAGNIKPLSAAEVREIIDEYAGQLNKSRAPGAKIKTSDDFYRGVSKETLNDRKTVRDARNAASVAGMETKVGGVVNQLVDLLLSEGSASGFSFSSKAIAMEILKDLRPADALDKPDSSIALTVAPITLRRNREGMVIARFQLGDGSIFSVGTNMNKQQLVEHLQNVLKAPAEETESEEVQEEPKDPEAKAPEAPKGPKAPPQPKESEGPQAPKAPKAPAPAQPKKTLKPSNARLVNEIKDAFAAVKDPVEMAKRKAPILRSLPQKKGRYQYSENDLETIANIEVRKNMSEAILEKLVPALRETRGLDVRNAELCHKVRAILGNKTEDADKLIDEITDALSTKPDFKAQIGKSAEPVEDDFDEPLNINAILGNNG